MEDDIIFKITDDGFGNMVPELRPDCDAAGLAHILTVICDAPVSGGRTMLNIMLAAAGLALAGVDKPLADEVWKATREQCDAVRERITAAAAE